jgi:hypothetical protein
MLIVVYNALSNLKLVLGWNYLLCKTYFIIFIFHSPCIFLIEYQEKKLIAMSMREAHPKKRTRKITWSYNKSNIFELSIGLNDMCRLLFIMHNKNFKLPDNIVHN